MRHLPRHLGHLGAHADLAAGDRDRLVQADRARIRRRTGHHESRLHDHAPAPRPFNDPLIFSHHTRDAPSPLHGPVDGRAANHPLSSALAGTPPYPGSGSGSGPAAVGRGRPIGPDPDGRVGARGRPRRRAPTRPKLRSDTDFGPKRHRFRPSVSTVDMFYVASVAFRVSTSQSPNGPWTCSWRPYLSTTTQTHPMTGLPVSRRHQVWIGFFPSRELIFTGSINCRRLSLSVLSNRTSSSAISKC